jgi:hypothetical protein
MNVEHLPSAIQLLIRPLLERHIEVWLIGSQANGNATVRSDWDFLVFGDAKLLRELSPLTPPPDLDLMVVYDGENFQSPWPRPTDGIHNGGDLALWKWSRTSRTTATYEGTKLPNDWGSARRAELVET